jgi:hypothetical protein
MGVSDGLGRAFIPLKIMDDGGADERELMPFDRAAYRYFCIYGAPERRAETDKTMRAAINCIKYQGERRHIFKSDHGFFRPPTKLIVTGLWIGAGFLCQSRAASSIESSENFRR